MFTNKYHDLKKRDNKLTHSFFYDSNLSQQNNLIAAYEGILNLAVNREIVFVIIPVENDILRWKKEIKKNSYKQQTWYQGLLSFEKRPQHRVSVLNLMDHLPTESDKLFFECDGHWSKNGNKWAAEVILNHIKANQLFN